MPANRTNQKFDFLLGGKGFMLARPDPKSGARAWQRSGTPDTPAVEQPRVASEFGGLPGQIDYPEVWNDWSGGFGYAYRHPKDENSYFGFLANPNTYHWSENFDARFTRQLVHAQKMQLLPTTGSFNAINSKALNFIDMPAPSLGPQLAGFGGVYILCAQTGASISNSARLYPKTANTFDIGPLSVIRNGMGKPAVFGSFVYLACNPDNGNDGVLFDALDDRVVFPLAIIEMPQRDGYSTAGNLLWSYMSANAGHGRRTMVQNTADMGGTNNIFPNPAEIPGVWSATISLGNGASQINDVHAFFDQILFGTEDGLYIGDTTGTFVNVLSDLEALANADNCRDITIHNGRAVVQHVAGIYSYKPTATDTAVVQEIGPAQDSNRSPIIGRVRALQAYGPWLYAGLWTGSQGYLLAGIEDTTGQSDKPYIWHPLQRFPHVASPQRLHFDGITVSSGGVNVLPSRMWVATNPTLSTNGTAPVYFWPIPAVNGNAIAPQMGFTANFANSARMDLGRTNGRTPITPKLYREVEIQADNLDGSQRWGLVYYTVDDGSRSLLGTINTSPKSTLYFSSGEGSFVSGQDIELSLESYIAAGAEATTPVYRSIVLRQMQIPRSIDVIQATVDLGDNMQDRQGTRMRPGAMQVNELRGLVGTVATQLVDVMGNSWWAKVLAPVEEQEQWQDGQVNPSVLANVKMAILSFTGN